MTGQQSRPRTPAQRRGALLAEALPHVPAELAERIRAELATPSRRGTNEPARYMVLRGKDRERVRAELVVTYRDTQSIREAAGRVTHDGRPLSQGLAYRLLLEAKALGADVQFLDKWQKGRKR